MSLRLTLAAQEGRIEELSALLSSGADPNERAALSKAPALSVACHYGQVECAKLLLRARADLNATNALGATALMQAAYRGEDEGGVQCVQLLLQEGASVAGRNGRSGAGALHYAVTSANPSVVSVDALIRAGAEVDAMDADNETPLQAAIFYQAGECVERLLDGGAKLDKLTRDEDLPRWFVEKITRRRRCLLGCRTFYGVLRRRLGVHRDMAHMMTRMLWESRRDAQWIGAF